MKGVSNEVLKHKHSETVQIPYGGKSAQRVVAVTRISNGYFVGVVTKRGHITGRIRWNAGKYEFPVFIAENGRRVAHAPLLLAIRDICLRSKAVA